MRAWIPIVALVMIAAGCGCLGGSEKSFDKAGALEFGLKIVKMYFDNDKDGFASLLAKEIYSLEGDGPYGREDVKQDILSEEYLADEDYPDHTMEEYLDVYDPYVLDSAEAEREYPEVIALVRTLGWEFDGNDHLFMGFETKPGKDEFLSDDPLVFAVTCEDDRWEFKAFSG